MTKRLIEVNDAKVDKAREVLGTATLKATIDGALDELIALHERRQALLSACEENAADILADDAQRRAAWG